MSFKVPEAIDQSLYKASDRCTATPLTGLLQCSLPGLGRERHGTFHTPGCCRNEATTLKLVDHVTTPDSLSFVPPMHISLWSRDHPQLTQCCPAHISLWSCDHHTGSRHRDHLHEPALPWGQRTKAWGNWFAWSNRPGGGYSMQIPTWVDEVPQFVPRKSHHHIFNNREKRYVTTAPFPAYKYGLKQQN